MIPEIIENTIVFLLIFLKFLVKKSPMIMLAMANLIPTNEKGSTIVTASFTITNVHPQKKTPMSRSNDAIKELLFFIRISIAI